MKRVLVGMSVLAAVLGFAPVAAAGPCRSGCLERLALSGGADLPYYGSYPLDGGSATPESAVVVVHGNNRDAAGYYDAIGKAGAGADTEVIAPHFQIAEDDPKAGDAEWGDGTHTWRDGGDSVRPAGISAFTAMDEVLAALADKRKFPNITRITVVGHSAGGQFVQRYAAGGEKPSGVRVRYVVANPSSYLYLDGERPYSTKNCPDYNDYKYGLAHRNRYLAALTDTQIITRYTARDVTYLLGEDDVHHDHGIDLSCPATAQGDYRLQRGESYYAKLHHDFPDAPHRMVLVPGVGHDDDAMFGSPQGKAAIFG